MRAERGCAERRRGACEKLEEQQQSLEKDKYI
jgi:hypothetical protein